ncbi:MAG: hypothetical protein KBF88_02660 [Polyangiaceae bacterium]|nr:hypothetical protein [Polyangiaceae bacterium]
MRMQPRYLVTVVAIVSACAPKRPAPAPNPIVTVGPRREEIAPKRNHVPTLKRLAAIAAPTEPLTPAESAAARPSWADPESYAPQFSEVALIPSEIPARSALDGRFLVCAVNVNYTVKDWEFGVGLEHTFLVGAKDVTRKAVLRVAVDVLKSGSKKPPSGAPTIFAQNYKEGNTLVLGVPLATAGAGDVLNFRVNDGPRRITTLPITVGKGLLEARNAKGDVECMPAARAEFDRTLGTALARLDVSLAELDRELAPGKSEFDSPEARETENALMEAAALVGWADPRIAGRIQQLNELIARFASEYREAIANVLTRAVEHDVTYEALAAVCKTKGAPMPTSPPVLAAALARYSYSPKDSGCVVTMKVTNKGPNEVRLSGELKDAVGAMQLVVSVGMVGPKGRLTDLRTIAPGSEGTLVLLSANSRHGFSAFWRPLLEAPFLLSLVGRELTKSVRGFSLERETQMKVRVPDEVLFPAAP